MRQLLPANPAANFLFQKAEESRLEEAIYLPSGQKIECQVVGWSSDQE